MPFRIYDENGNPISGNLRVNHEPKPLENKESKGWREILDNLRSWTVPGTIFYPDDVDIDKLEDKLFDDEVA